MGNESQNDGYDWDPATWSLSRFLRMLATGAAICLALAIFPPFEWLPRIPESLTDPTYWVSFAFWYMPLVGGLACTRFRKRFPILGRWAEFFKSMT
jgi:hypothetical protein